MRSTSTAAVLCLLLLLPAVPARAQQTSTPSLRRRSDRHVPRNQRDNFASTGSFTLPDDVSGAYHFDRDNESIEMDFERTRKGLVRLTGYISRLGDAETDSNTPLTYFFDKTSIDGDQLAFQTGVVHGVWYSFRGTIFRGRAAERDQDGYYVLHGVLEQHHPAGGADQKSADETIETRTVNFKSIGR